MQTPIKVAPKLQPGWVAFLIQTAISAVQLYLSGTELSAKVKTDVQNLITAAGRLIGDIVPSAVKPKSSNLLPELPLQSFWVSFLIQSSLTAVAEWIASGTLPEKTKTDAEAVIAAGSVLITDL